jgi:F-type H+-transporting ATPase subunit b
MSIDWWTLGIETVNVAVLVWLLGRFFWRPVSAMIAERRAEATRLLEEAEARKKEAAAALDDIRKTRDGFAAEREAVLAQARADAGKERGALIETARADAAALQAEARAATEAERAAAEAEWTARSARLAVEIARKLMARLDGAHVQGAFTDWLVAAIGKLPDDTRKAAVSGGATLEALSAAPVDARMQGEIAMRISQALGASPAITFGTDPSLIAGLELRGPHLAIANSWKADLDRILAEVAHER